MGCFRLTYTKEGADVFTGNSGIRILSGKIKEANKLNNVSENWGTYPRDKNCHE